MQLYRVEGFTGFADAYGAGTFGNCDYNSSTCTNGANAGGLANTGVMLVSVVTLACLIVLVAIAVRVWRRPAKPAAQEAAIDENTAESDDASTGSPSSTDRQI